MYLGSNRIDGFYIGTRKVLAKYLGSNIIYQSGMNYSAIENVMDYGAKGDGITNDTSSFNSALAVGDIYIPEGEYKLFDIHPPSNRNIYGSDSGNTILSFYSATATNGSSLFGLYTRENISFNNLVIDMMIDGAIYGDAWSGYRCMYIRTSTNITLNNVTFQNNGHGCVYMGGSSYVYFNDCKFLNVDTGINSDQSPWYDSHIFVDSCYFDGNEYSEPVYFDRADDIQVTNCTAKNKTHGSAFRFDLCTNILVHNNTVDNMGNGVYIENCDYVDIVGNTITNSVWDNIKEITCTNVTKTDNILG